MARKIKTYGLVLTRSDAGDGGWSLHPAGTTDEQIAEGLVEPLLTGEADMVDGVWDRPTEADYREAAGVARELAQDLERTAWGRADHGQLVVLPGGEDA